MHTRVGVGGWRKGQEGRGEIRQSLCLKKRGRKWEINILLRAASFMQFTVADLDQTQSVFKPS